MSRTPKMTRSHFELIAYLLGTALNDVRCTDLSAEQAVLHVMGNFLSELPATNPTFDRAKFRQAVQEYSNGERRL